MVQTGKRYQSLNAAQRNAVFHFGNPLLILASAGSGKTKVITTKIDHLIETVGVDPHTIVAITFTNKAANEMRERAIALNAQAQSATISTFHAFGARFLRKYARTIDFSPSFTIYDDEDSFALLKTVAPNDTTAFLQSMYRRIARAKNYGLSAQDDLTVIDPTNRLQQYYQAYQKKLDTIGNVDFGDLILKPIQILNANADIRSSEQNKTNILLVDEFQDINSAQYRLIEALYHDGMYLCVVGDDDQTIYSFRGSDIAHIYHFEQSFRQAETMQLDQNYRSTAHILAIANTLVNHNKKRHAKRLWTTDVRGVKPRLVFVDDDYQEARFVISALQHDWDSVETAIVYRTNAQSRIFESELVRAEIPYAIVGSVRFYERSEIKDIIAFLKCIANPKDEISLRRIINKPTRGIGKVTLQTLLSYADARDMSVVEALSDASLDIRTSAREAMHALGQIFDMCNDALRSKSDAHVRTAAPLNTLGDVIAYIVSSSGLLAYYKAMDQESNSAKEHNISEIINAATLYQATHLGLQMFLEKVELESATDALQNHQNIVTLITIHNTKGLEFERVFIAGLVEGLLPHHDNNSEEKIEEERRLLYVAITRAKQDLFFCTYTVRHQFGKTVQYQPSRFIAELKQEALTIKHASLSRTSPSLSQSRYQSNTHRERTPNSAPSTLHNRYVSHNDGRLFAIGARVYHDDYGSGEVVTRQSDGDQFVIGVQFESGQQAHFIERYAALEHIAD